MSEKNLNDNEKEDDINKVETSKEDVEGEKEVEDLQINDSNSLEQTNEKPSANGLSFGKRLEAIVIDEIMIAAISYILLLLFDLILRKIFGMYIVEMVGMYVIFFIGFSVIYPLIFESTKLKNTIGRKIAGIEIVAASQTK